MFVRECALTPGDIVPLSAARRERRRLTAWTRFVSVVALLAACTSVHPSAFRAAMARADRATAHDEREVALAAFDEAARCARTRGEQDEARHAAARLLLGGGLANEAATRLEAIVHDGAGTEAGSSAYDLALAHLAAGATSRGFEELRQIVLERPNDPAARPALKRWLAHLDEEGGPEAALEWLRRSEGALAGTEREDEILYAIALRLEATGRLEDARRAFLDVATRWPYPGGSLWDDALVHASQVAEVEGHAGDAVADLRRLLARRERALLVGSAERARYAPAQFHLGELYRDALHEPTQARIAFHDLYASFPDSPMRDAGLYEEASVLRTQMGDLERACTTLERLVREFPGSRYVPCALEICPSLPRPTASSQRTCPRLRPAQVH